MPRMPGVPFQSVPHFNHGRGGVRVNLIVIHQFAGASMPGTSAIQNWLRNPASRVSYHFGVDRNGRIVQWVDTSATAWATGNANSRSIAIGHQANNTQLVTPAQIDATARIIRWARGAHGGIPRSDGVGWHRQFMQTACPGDPIIRQIPELRRRAGQAPASGGTRHVADGTISLATFAQRRGNTRPQVLVERSFRGEPNSNNTLNQGNRTRMAEYLVGGASRTMPRGLVYWTSAGGGQRWEANGTQSLEQVARSRNTTALQLIRASFATGRLNTTNRRRMVMYLTDGGGANRTMPRGLVFWTVN
jgi:hypothetical protein